MNDAPEPATNASAPDLVGHAYIAISAASASIVDLIDGVRTGDLPAQAEVGEVAEQLATALHSSIAIVLQGVALAADYRDALGQLQAAAARFIEGWA